ncbi:MAG: DNA/RNA helicase domain-containing protein, partial [Thermoanaerobaculales bacterium]
LYEYELEAQFRCAGSDAFVGWVDNTLGVRRTANALWEHSDAFDFQIIGSAEELEARIREKVTVGATARLAAGFCWPWSKPRPDGTLVPDVVIGAWQRPWNAPSNKGRLAKGIPKKDFWASDPAGIEQVGCIYTAQGFEFDYIGVIFGRDLRYDPRSGTWIGDPSESGDRLVRGARANFVDLVKNTYRVLLTRGIRGCYVHFLDRDTEQFFRARIAGPGA